ncbi:hypothetical protein AB0I98_48500, partial [Streptomyces sp. NPDC050211]
PDGPGRAPFSVSAHEKDPDNHTALRHPPATGNTRGRASIELNSTPFVLNEGQGPVHGHPALLVGLFAPKEESAPGESAELIYWREL